MPALHVYDGVNKLEEKSDYTVSYANNINAGTATATVKFRGNYASTPQQSVSFTIAPASFGSAFKANDLAVTVGKNDGAQKPVPTVPWKETGKSLAKSQYEVSYEKNGAPVTAITKAGTYTAVIAPKDTKNFTGSVPVNVKKGTAKVTLTAVQKKDSEAGIVYGGSKTLTFR